MHLFRSEMLFRKKLTIENSYIINIVSYYIVKFIDFNLKILNC